MRIISGTTKPTPVLCDIAPRHFRQQAALLKEWTKIRTNAEFPIFSSKKGQRSRAKKYTDRKRGQAGYVLSPTLFNGYSESSGICFGNEKRG